MVDKRITGWIAALGVAMAGYGRLFWEGTPVDEWACIPPGDVVTSLIRDGVGV